MALVSTVNPSIVLPLIEGLKNEVICRENRIRTLARDTLTHQPEWVVDEIRRLHTTGQLTTLAPEALATHITAKAVVLDGGQPSTPPQLEPPTADLTPA